MNLKAIFTKVCVLVLLATHTQCATSQKMDTTPPIRIDKAYFEKWTDADNEAGFTVYIPADATAKLTLDFAYFKGKKITLILDTDTSVYKGRYIYPKRDNDLIMSDDPKKEFKNTVTGIERIPFRLKDNECVVTYTKDDAQGHFKIDNLPEK